MKKHRVVITGMGAVTPMGNTRDIFWSALLAGKSGIDRIASFDPSDLATKIAGEVRGFDPDALIGRRDARRMDRYAQFAFVAAAEALADAGFPSDPLVRESTAVIVATGIGGIMTLEDQVTKARELGTAKRVSPFFIPMLMSNAAPAHISMHHGLRGPTFATSSACASSNDAISTAFRLVASGDCIAAVTGGAEATVTDIAMGGFCSMKALSTRNDEPTKASRPFDRDRDGFVLAEGGAILILEQLEFALERGARIYAELLGVGQSADAYDLVAPDPTGGGVALAMTRALASAGVKPADIDYVNAHATSTPLGDASESAAIAKVLASDGRHLAVSSTKSMHGHTLGAAGAIEGVATVLAVYHDIIPPTINLDFPDPECTLDFVPLIARKATVNIAMSNSFGFGGHNAVVIFGKYRA